MCHRLMQVWLMMEPVLMIHGPYSYALRKHKDILKNVGLLIYCAPCKLKYFEAFGCCRILVEQPNSQNDQDHLQSNHCSQSVMQVWLVNSHWKIIRDLWGVMGDYVERAAKRAGRVALLNVLIHLEKHTHVQAWTVNDREWTKTFAAKSNIFIYIYIYKVFDRKTIVGIGFGWPSW